MRAFRAAYGLTQEDAAELTWQSTEAWRAQEQGRRKPQPQTALLIRMPIGALQRALPHRPRSTTTPPART